MAEDEKIMDHLKDVFVGKQADLNGQSGKPLHDFQKRSFDALSRVDFPDRKHEDWKYTSVKKIIAPKYQLPSHHPDVQVRPIPGIDSHIISIINGKADFKDIHPQLAAAGVTLSPLQDAFENNSWKDAFSKWVHSPDLTVNRAFEFLNFSFLSEGFFLDIPKNTILDKPLEIRIVHDDPEISFSHPLYFIRCGAGSKIDIIERFENNQSCFNPSQDSLINSIGYYHIEKNAAVRHIKWQDLPMEQHLVYKLFV